MKRTLDTMSDAIALSSPSGKMSKRAKLAAQERLRQSLFGDGLPYPKRPDTPLSQRLRHQAEELETLAGRGMKPIAYRKRAAELREEADKLDRPPGRKGE